MTVPDITVEISFDDVSDTTPAWTDITTYVDSFTVTRGRNHELSRIDAGTASVVLDNGDGRFTPAKAAGAYSPNIVPRRRLRITAVWSAVTYRRFTGYVESWRVVPSPHPDRFSQVQLGAVDAFKILSGVRLFAAYAERIFQDAPASYVPLTEGPGTRWAGNKVSGSATSVLLIYSKSGFAGTDFGGEKVLRFGDIGTSLNMNPTSTAVRADILDCTYIASAFPTSGSFWTFEAWLTYDQVPGGTHYLLRHQSKHGTGINGFALSIHTDGKLYVSTGSETDVIVTAASLVDSTPHHVALVYTTGGSFGHALLYFDGGLVADYTLTASIFPFGEQAAPANTFCCVGGVHYASNIQDGGMRARLGHVATYADDLNSSQISGHYAAGFTGSPENENTRLGVLLDFAAWSASDRSLEAGMANTLDGRDWADPTPALNELSDSAASAGGVLFMAGDNKITYHNRTHRYNRTVDQAFSGLDQVPEVDNATFTSDDSEIRNDIDASRASQGRFNVQDAASISKYGAINYSLSIGVTSDTEVTDAASWALYLYADPLSRVPALTWKPSTNATALYPKLLDLEIGDRITVANLPATVPDGPIDAFVEQIAESFDGKAGDYLFTFQLSPAARFDISKWDTGEWGGGGSPQLIWGY